MVLLLYTKRTCAKEQESTTLAHIKFVAHLRTKHEGWRTGRAAGAGYLIRHGGARSAEKAGAAVKYICSKTYISTTSEKNIRLLIQY